MKEKLNVFLERYFLGLARVVLYIYKPYIIGITGSVGKTTTKDALAFVLREAGLEVKKTEGNLNADLGIALAVLGYDHSPSIYEWPLAFLILNFNWILLLFRLKKLEPYFVVEMGIDRLGDMSRMIKTVKPTIGIVTWIGEGHHLEYLKDPQTVAHEKGQMLTVLPKDGLAVLPAHDSQIATLEKLSTAPVKKINATGREALPEIIHTVAEHLRLDETVVSDAIKHIPQSKGRLAFLSGIRQSTLIDDTYNSSLPAAKLALEVLEKTPGKRHVAVLADILEQGDKEESVHKQVAKLSREKADLLIGVGKRMKKVEPDYWYDSPDAAALAIPELIKPGDVVLVKGSQGMRMEKVSHVLAAHADEAKEKLPRQTKRWFEIPFANP